MSHQTRAEIKIESAWVSYHQCVCWVGLGVEVLVSDNDLVDRQNSPSVASPATSSFFAPNNS